MDPGERIRATRQGRRPRIREGVLHAAAGVVVGGNDGGVAAVAAVEFQSQPIAG